MELAGQPMHTLHHTYGIDFSGAQDAGKKIWSGKALSLEQGISFPGLFFHVAREP